MRFTVRVPATSANLGPGYDSFGLAHDLCNEVTVDTEGVPGAMTWKGEGAGELATDGSDLFSRTMRAVAQREPDVPPLPPLRIDAVNRIPLESGLGSSSAAIVAAVAAARRLFGHALDLDEVFTRARDVEGHPDNVAAATYGGFTIVADGVASRMDPHEALRPVVLVPKATRLSTATARAALSSEVPREDAVFDLSHAALVAIGLTRVPELLFAGLHDRLHEDARMAFVPEVGAALKQIRGRGIPACVSGAGPSLLAFESDERIVPDLGTSWQILRPGVRARGVEILES